MRGPKSWVDLRSRYRESKYILKLIVKSLTKSHNNQDFEALSALGVGTAIGIAVIPDIEIIWVGGGGIGAGG